MNNLRYSIIYGVIRPEISEQISIGIIIVDGNNVKVLISEEKLHALGTLIRPSEYKAVSEVLHSLVTNQSIQSVENIGYLARYSNNLITISNLKDINLEPTQENQEWLFQNYVHKSVSFQAA